MKRHWRSTRSNSGVHGDDGWPRPPQGTKTERSSSVRQGQWEHGPGKRRGGLGTGTLGQWEDNMISYSWSDGGQRFAEHGEAEQRHRPRPCGRGWSLGEWWQRLTPRWRRRQSDRTQRMRTQRKSAKQAGGRDLRPTRSGSTDRRSWQSIESYLGLHVWTLVESERRQ